MSEEKRFTLEAADRIRRIKPFLSGIEPSMQGFVLAELTAMWFAGHAPHVRQAVIDSYIEAMLGLIPICEDVMFDGKGHPGTVQQ